MLLRQFRRRALPEEGHRLQAARRSGREDLQDAVGPRAHRRLRGVQRLQLAEPDLFDLGRGSRRSAAAHRKRPGRQRPARSSRPGSSTSSDLNGIGRGMASSPVLFHMGGEGSVRPELRRVRQQPKPGRGHRRFQRRRGGTLPRSPRRSRRFPPITGQLLPRRAAHHRPADAAANAYVERDLPARRAIHRRRFRRRQLFDLLEASFSMVTAEPSRASTAAASAAFRFHRPEIFRAAALPARSARTAARPSTASARPASSG